MFTSENLPPWKWILQVLLKLFWGPLLALFGAQFEVALRHDCFNRHRHG